MIIQVNPAHPSPYQIERLVTYLDDDGVIAVPTDTTYALACRPTKKNALEKLIRLRQLDRKKALALVFASIQQVAKHTLLDDAAFRILKRNLPGPYCFILESNRHLPKAIGDKRKRVGVRIPSHPVPVAIVEAIGEPLIVTTAIDPETGLAAHDPWTVENVFGHGLAAVVDADALPGDVSTVIDLTTPEPELLRAGLGPSEGIVG